MKNRFAKSDREGAENIAFTAKLLLGLGALVVLAVLL